MTQADLAALAGIALKTVRLLETTRGTLASWDAALAALGLSIIGRNLPAAATLGKPHRGPSPQPGLQPAGTCRAG